jgi:ABC-type multidrug transport system fused ATPase/permease subunit
VERERERESRGGMDKDEMDRSLIFFEFEMMYQGIASVRAYGAEKRMHNHFIHLIDANHRAFIMFVHSSRWLGVRLDFVAAICVTLTALLVVLRRHSIGPGLAGVVLVQSLQITDFFQYGVRMASETENYFTSVERIQALLSLPFLLSSVLNTNKRLHHIF